MITLVISEREGPPLTPLVFSKPEVTLGRVQGNDVVLPRGNVSKRHARLIYKDGKYILVDLRSTNGTYVTGRKLTSPLVVRTTDKIYIGDYLLTIADEPEDAPTLAGVSVPYIPADATEQQLLEALVRGDEMSREVYADWLEERGDARAEFLRLQQQIVHTAPDDPALAHRTSRLRVLVDELPLPWRVQVARPPVEGCEIQFELQCPREWGSFQPTDNPSVRHCDTCRKSVHSCGSVVEARRHATLGNCIAIDLGAMRWAGDVDPPYDVRCRNPRCGLDIGSHARQCPSCGASVRPPVMLGGIPAPIK